MPSSCYEEFITMRCAISYIDEKAKNYALKVFQKTCLALFKLCRTYVEARTINHRFFFREDGARSDFLLC